VQSFTACVSLLTATSAFVLRRRRWSSPQQALYCLIQAVIIYMHILVYCIVVYCTSVAGLSSRVVSASDCGVRGSRFESRR